MKIFSWNIRGSGYPSKRRAIREVFCKANPDIVVLQETEREELSGELMDVSFQRMISFTSSR